MSLTVEFKLPEPVDVFDALKQMQLRLALYGGMQIHQSGLIPFGEIVWVDGRLMIPRTRPTLRFPLYEDAALHAGIRPWYWDVGSWPHRESLDPREYLTWLGVLH